MDLLSSLARLRTREPYLLVCCSSSELISPSRSLNPNSLSTCCLFIAAIVFHVKFFSLIGIDGDGIGLLGFGITRYTGSGGLGGSETYLGFTVVGAAFRAIQS